MRWVVWAAVVVAGAVAACVGDDSSAVDGGGKDAALEAAAGFCATHTTGTTFLCADFDGPSLDAGWTSSVTTGGGSLSLESTDVSSPPNALLATLPASSTPTKALLQLDPVGAPAQFSGAVRLAVRSPACFQAGDVVTIAALQFFTSNVLPRCTSGQCDRIVFVTDTEYFADFGSGSDPFAAAAADCMQQAQQNQIAGTFKAWIATQQGSPRWSSHGAWGRWRPS